MKSTYRKKTREEWYQDCSDIRYCLATGNSKGAFRWEKVFTPTNDICYLLVNTRNNTVIARLSNVLRSRRRSLRQHRRLQVRENSIYANLIMECTPTPSLGIKHLSPNLKYTRRGIPHDQSVFELPYSREGYRIRVDDRIPDVILPYEELREMGSRITLEEYEQLRAN